MKKIIKTTMSKFNLKNTLSLLSGITIMCLFLVSCNNEDDSADSSSISTDLEIAEEIVEIDDTGESINEIIEGTFLEVASTDLYKSSEYKFQANRRFLSDCVVISKELKEDHIEIILDYGDGCTTKRDHIAKGKIVIQADLNIKDAAVNMNYTFDNFYINDKKIEGQVEKTRTLINENGNRESQISKEITMIWEDGSESSIKGERTREWVEGDDNDIWSDNVFSISGSSVITRKNGKVFTETITQPLIRNLACKFIVSGIVEITSDENTRQIDYGDGSCDDVAMLTKNDETFEIKIRRKRKK